MIPIFEVSRGTTDTEWAKRIERLTMNVRILLADDHKIMREGLQALIEQQPGLRVVGEAENGATTVHLAKRLRPDVVIKPPANSFQN